MNKRDILPCVLLVLFLLVLTGCVGNIPGAPNPTETSTIPPTATNTLIPTATEKPKPTATPSPNDNFNDNIVDTRLWQASPHGNGPKIEESNNKIQIFLPANSSKVYSGNVLNFGAGYYSRFRLSGDFDIEVEYRILKWPKNNGASVTLAVYPGGSVERVRWSGPGRNDYYITNYFGSAPGVIFDIAGNTKTTDDWGKLRLTRIGDELTGYYFHDGEWIAIRKGKVDTQPVEVDIASINHGDYNDTSPSNDIQLEFDNFIINKGDVIWP